MAALPGLRMTDSDTVDEALSVAKTTGQEFADAYIHAAALKGQADLPLRHEDAVLVDDGDRVGNVSFALPVRS